jgi:formylglycine-generating enzyme required for sulfatase activity
VLARQRPFWRGSSISPNQANYDGSADPYKGGGTKRLYRKGTVAVDSFEGDPWGLFNVHGNVRDWVEDCWNNSNTGNPGDGTARTIGDCNRRVVRGGSWLVSPQILRAAAPPPAPGSTASARLALPGIFIIHGMPQGEKRRCRGRPTLLATPKFADFAKKANPWR